MKKIDYLILKHELENKDVERIKQKLKILGRSQIKHTSNGMSYYKVDKYIIDNEFDKTNDNEMAVCARDKISSLEKKRQTLFEGRETKHQGFYHYIPANNQLSNYTRYWTFPDGKLKLQTTIDADNKKVVLDLIDKIQNEQ